MQDNILWGQIGEIYRRLDELEPVEFETLSYRPRRPLFIYPVGIFFVIYLTYHLLMAARSLFRRKGKPAHV